MGAHITPTLSKGLVELCRAKPADPRTWLAEWLLANKPAPKLAAEGTAAAVQGVIDMYATPEGKAALQELWVTLDKNGDGTISSKEWGKGIAANWKTMSKFFGGATKAEAGKAFKKIDVDGSGDLTWEEFEGAIAGMDASLRLAQALESAEGDIVLLAPPSGAPVQYRTLEARPFDAKPQYRTLTGMGNPSWKPRGWRGWQP